MRVYLAAGEAVFAHECEHKRHSVSVGWRPGDPAVDENTLPPCPACGQSYQRVPVCTGTVRHDASGRGGDHDCHPLSGHVERSDDPAAGLVEALEMDPFEAEVRRLRTLKWEIETRQVRDQTRALLEADRFEDTERASAEWQRADAALTYHTARKALRDAGLDPDA